MTATLHKIYPGLVEVANEAIDLAGLPGLRPQAVWWDGHRWQVGPSDSLKFFSRPPSARIAGVYTAQARPLDIVQDMLIAMGELEAVR